jgi:capsular polysaccharide biosynthesis protein
MPSHLDSKSVLISVKVYELLLAACPAEFRREYGPAMKQLFRDQCRDAWNEKRGWGLAAWWLRALPDLAKTAFVEHLTSLRRRESLFAKIVRAIRADPMARAAFVRMFVVVFLLCMLASVLLSIWTPKRYSSMVRIEVQKEAPEARAGEAPQAIASPDPYFLATQLKIIQSYSNLTNVIGKLRLDSKLAQQNGFTRWTMDQTFAYLSKKISVQQTRGTGLIEISTKNADPVLAADIANSIASYYREARLELWKQTHQTNVATGSLEQGLPEKPRPFNLSVIVRDPARPSRQAVLGPTDFLLMGVCGGTLLALLARGASSLFTLLRQRLTHRQGTPSSAA